MRHVELCQVKNISARIDKICIERFETQILLPSQEHKKKFAQQKISIHLSLSKRIFFALESKMNQYLLLLCKRLNR